MPHVNIKIQNAGTGETNAIGLTPEQTIAIEEGALSQFVILEKGMTSGKTSVSMLIELPDGRQVFAQTSAAIFEGMAAALCGAELRFKEQGS